MASPAEKKVRDLNEDMADQMAILRDDISTLKHTIAELGKAQGSHLRTVAAEKADALANKGAQTAEDLRRAANKGLVDTENAVRANPAAAMGIAAGAGFLVGLLLSRRS